MGIAALDGHNRLGSTCRVWSLDYRDADRRLDQRGSAGTERRCGEDGGRTCADPPGRSGGAVRTARAAAVTERRLGEEGAEERRGCGSAGDRAAALRSPVERPHGGPVCQGSTSDSKTVFGRTRDAIPSPSMTAASPK